MNIEPPTAGPRRWGTFIWASGSVVFLVGVALVATLRRAESRAVPPARPASGDGAWELTSEGDFEEKAADFTGSRLRLRAATRGTRNDTVKFFGMRRRAEIRLGEGARVSVDLDWNHQANGSGLTAGLVLAPAPTSANPLETPAALWVEYVGVPPGKNARLVIGTRESNSPLYLHTEGWPDTDRAGRPIGLQRIEVVIGKDGAFRVLENGRVVFASEPGALSFDQAYLYLQMSSRSNYPPREVFFDNVVVEAHK